MKYKKHWKAFFLLNLLFIIGYGLTQTKSREPLLNPEARPPIEETTAAPIEVPDFPAPSAGPPRPGEVGRDVEPYTKFPSLPDPTGTRDAEAQGARARSTSPAPPTAAANGGVKNGHATETDKLLEQLKQGAFIFDSPSNMMKNKVQIIELVLYPPGVEASEPTETQLRDSALVSNRMEALLTGTNFLINPVTPTVQAISGKNSTRWAWEVIAEQGGEQTLYLSLLAHLTVEGTSTPFVIKTYERPIIITVSVTSTVLDFLSTNWQWVFATLLLPLIGYLYNKFKRRNNRV